MIALMLSAVLAEEAAEAAEDYATEGDITMTVTGPVGEAHALNGPMPWAGELEWTVGKKAYALDLTAELKEGKADVKGQLFEVKKGKKKKVVGQLKLSSLREDREGDTDTKVPAPKGYVNDEGVPIAQWDLVASWSSGWDAPARDPKAPEGWSDATFVLLGNGAALTSDKDNVVARLGEDLRPFQLVEEEDGWLKVKPVVAAEAGQHCQAVDGPLAAMDVSFWVEKTSLASVAPSALKASYDDGTAVELRAGVGVVAGDAGPTVNTGSLSFPVTLDGWADRYTVENGFSEPEDPRLRLYTRTDLMLAVLNGENVTADSTFTAFPVRGKKGQSYTVGNACSELTVVNTGATPTKAEKSFTKDPPKVAARKPTATVADGAEVFWASGRKAGTVSGTLTLYSGLGDKKGKSCTAMSLSEGAPEPDRLSVCFQPGDVTKSE